MVVTVVVVSLVAWLWRCLMWGHGLRFPQHDSGSFRMLVSDIEVREIDIGSKNWERGSTT